MPFMCTAELSWAGSRPAVLIQPLPSKQSLLLARAAELGCRACFLHPGHFIELYKLCWSSWHPWESDPIFAGTSWNKKG